MSFNIEAEARNDEGTGASRRLRAAGRVPAVLYGQGKKAQSISVDANAIYHDLQRPEFHTKINELTLDGKVYKVVVRDFQMHPWKKIVLHVDFQIVEGEEVIRIRVPFELENAAISPAVKLQGGRVSKLANTIELLVKANAIPECLTMDVSDIKAGDIFHLDSVKLPEGCRSPLLGRGINPAVCLASGKKGGQKAQEKSQKADDDQAKDEGQEGGDGENAEA